MTLTVTCAGCGEEFEARSTKAKWCSDRCRKAKRPEPPAEDDAASSEPVDQGLVESVRRELEAAGRVGTFAGQLALQLAKRLQSPDESGISSLSRELRTVMAAALEGVAPPAAEDGSDEEPEDEVEKARRRREEAREAAGLS